MTTTTPKARRQLVGRRLALAPYYTISEQHAEYLVLTSQPGANSPAGNRVIAGGLLLLALALFILISGGLSAFQPGGSIGLLAISMGIGGLLMGLGFVRLMGGIAVATTANRILVDRRTRSIDFVQHNRVARERKQTVPFEELRTLRLMQRRLVSGGFMGRVYPVTVLELVLAGNAVWIIDSAHQAGDLDAVATALSTILALPLQGGEVGSEQASGEQEEHQG
jgi:hypothetical protein